MKKIVIMIAVISLAFGANAQIGSLINAAANSAKRSLEKRIDKEVDSLTNKAADGAKNAILGKLGISKPAATSNNSSTTKTMTPRDYMAQLPEFPTDAQIADYACLMSKDNPSTIKMMTNPVAVYLAKVAMMTTDAAGSVNTMTEERAAQLEANYRNQIEEFYGVSAEELEKMSDEELQALTYKKMYGEGKLESTAKKAEVIDPVAPLLDKYTALTEQVEEIFAKADRACQDIWDTKYRKESQLCNYYKDAAKVYSEAVRQAMELRRTEQLKLAEQMDKEIADYVAKNPTSNADQVNYTHLTMIAYFSDANRVASIYQPSIE